MKTTSIEKTVDELVDLFEKDHFFRRERILETVWDLFTLLQKTQYLVLQKVQFIDGENTDDEDVCIGAPHYIISSGFSFIDPDKTLLSELVDNNESLNEEIDDLKKLIVRKIEKLIKIAKSK